MKCFAYKGPLASGDGDQFTDRVIVSASTMARLALTLALVGTLACGSSSPKSETIGTDTPRTTPSDSENSTTNSDTDAETPSASLKSKVPITPAPFSLRNGLVYKGYILGGLPTKENIDAALEKEIESALSLMSKDEPGISVIGPYAASKGFRYIRFTIAGTEDLNESMAWQFASTLPLIDKPGIVHSADGNRVGAIFALMAYFVDELPAQEALAIGQAIGLGDLEAHVRSVLELPAE